MNSNGYQQYKEQSVMTMTQGEMLIILYDEMLKRLARAEMAIDKEEYEVFEQSAERCVDIVQYLQDTLNREYEISSELRKMYDFFIYELGRIKAGRKKEVIQELMPLVRELKGAFLEAEKKA